MPIFTASWNHGKLGWLAPRLHPVLHGARNEELQRSQDAMAESLRESKGSFNATLGDMKALWREVARLQQAALAAS
eukprot:s5148_g6.t1